jgi:hypothetical protein
VIPHGLPNILATYGNPIPYVDRKGEWERIILATRTLRIALPYAYAADTTVRTIRAHKLVVDELVELLARAAERVGDLSRIAYGGCYVWRPKRRGRGLSTHTWGIAIDLDPARNRQGDAWNPATGIPEEVARVFLDAGWIHGAEWDTPDSQHFQRVSGY